MCMSHFRASGRAYHATSAAAEGVAGERKQTLSTKEQFDISVKFKASRES